MVVVEVVEGIRPERVAGRRPGRLVAGPLMTSVNLCCGLEGA